MKVLALERAVADVNADGFTEELLRSESAAVWDLYLAGVLREAYFSTGKHEAVLVLEAASLQEASEKVSGLPLAKAGLIRFEVIGLEPYTGWARLFSRRA